jgi:hypothetical protein
LGLGQTKPKNGGTQMGKQRKKNTKKKRNGKGLNKMAQRPEK